MLLNVRFSADSIPSALTIFSITYRVVVLRVCRKVCSKVFFLLNRRVLLTVVVVEGLANDLDFRMLILHCSLDILVPHRLHHRSQIAGS
jgi:hypothetical protein